MLPFTKRNAHAADGYEGTDVVSTGEIEVLGSSQRPLARTLPPSSRPGGRVSERPRVYELSVSDEEMTRLMPMRPSTRAVAPNVQFSSTRRSVDWAMGSPMTIDQESRTLVRPSSTLPPAPTTTRPTPRVMMPAPAPLPTEFSVMIPPSPSSTPAVTISADSSSRIDPPATVITTRTRVLPGRPTATWAAALVAMGVFVGLASAVLARGDADSVVDATASFVDPSRASLSAAGAQLPAMTMNAPSNPVAALMPAAAPVVAPIAPADRLPSELVADSRRNIAPPVAYAAPAAPRTQWVAPRRAVRPAAPPVVAAAPAPASEPKQAVASYNPPPPPKAVAKRGRKASEEDMESASAADALARAQLEAALR